MDSVKGTVTKKTVSSKMMVRKNCFITFHD